ncbi:MAG: polysaccharide deacetylase family protein [Candidatus Acidiferrales bacterium]
MIPASIAALAGAAGIAGAGAFGAMHPASQLFGRTIRHAGNQRALALTFDDGPNPRITPQLLDLLERHQIQATFFVIGKFARECAALTAEIAARGHLLGNHTESHPDLIWLGSKRIEAELARCQEAIHRSTGKTAVWMRPPYGFRGPQLDAAVRRGGFKAVVMWSAWAWDWKPQAAEPVIHRLRRVRGGDIVLLHDGDHRALNGDRIHTVAALEYWLPRWKDAGREFVTIDSISPA